MSSSSSSSSSSAAAAAMVFKVSETIDKKKDDNQFMLLNADGFSGPERPSDDDSKQYVAGIVGIATISTDLEYMTIDFNDVACPEFYCSVNINIRKMEKQVIDSENPQLYVVPAQGRVPGSVRHSFTATVDPTWRVIVRARTEEKASSRCWVEGVIPVAAISTYMSNARSEAAMK